MAEVPVPVPGPGEVLIEVKAAGVCLSDLHLIDGTLVPLYPDASDAVTQQCADCARRRPCTQVRTRGIDDDGGWAQYAIACEDTLVPIPDELPFDQAAIIPDAVSTPYAAVVATAGRGLDFAFDCAGVPAVREQAAAALGRDGGSPESVSELVRLASDGRLDLAPSISDHIPLAYAAEPIHRLEHKIGDPIRLILVP
ncbi:MDR/zinc-dependent alcohol dehydrogenase-like family protein [Nonomuraea montanisoli]|uniref:hypothetical protein n=1 Tax=Nonomuraea montanisoli TaxID=2741721 RepID=UPI002E2C3B0E|nr:hypothetical protein [Nonomuraea montanisoli]